MCPLPPLPPLPPLAFASRLVSCVALAVLGAGCRPGPTEAERLASEEATATAEDIAREASLTSATLSLGSQSEADDAAPGSRADAAAFTLERSEYRSRLQQALDQLDTDIARGRRSSARAGDKRGRELRVRRALLKDDLDAVRRATAQDWATLRRKVERDLARGRPAVQPPTRSAPARREAP
jgi:uncharacterized protein YdcH (DUF465 family)